jgi:exonuclease VII large subunit
MNWSVLIRAAFLTVVLAILITPADLAESSQKTKGEKKPQTPHYSGELEERMKEFQQHMEDWTKRFEKEFQSQEKQEWLHRFEKQAQEFQKQLEERTKELEKSCRAKSGRISFVDSRNVPASSRNKWRNAPRHFKNA